MDEPQAAPSAEGTGELPCPPVCGGLRAIDRRQMDLGVPPELDGRKPKGRRWSDDPDLKAEHERVMVRLSTDLHRIRQRQGWSLEQWARVAGVHPETVLSIEQARTDPQISTLIRLLYPAGFTLQLALRPSAVGDPAEN